MASKALDMCKKKISVQASQIKVLSNKCRRKNAIIAKHIETIKALSAEIKRNNVELTERKQEIEFYKSVHAFTDEKQIRFATQQQQQQHRK